MRTSILIALGLALVTGCKKDDDTPAPTGGNNGGGGPAAPGDVYVCGSEAPSATMRALYWKNGAPHYLSDGSTRATANAITTGNGVVYVVGRQEDLTTGQYRAVLWQNGTASYLTPPSAPHCSANDVAVGGPNVYVCGHSRVTGSNAKATVWVNGNATELTDGVQEASAEGIHVSNGDVYVAGVEGGVAKYWLNGTAVVLGTGTVSSGASEVWVANGHVYVAGYEVVNAGQEEAVLWVDGVRQTLSSNGGAAYGLWVDDAHTYIAGTDNDRLHHLAYWENGVPDSPALPPTLLSEMGLCTDICVRDGVVHTTTLIYYLGEPGSYHSNNSTGTWTHLNGVAWGIWVE